MINSLPEKFVKGVKLNSWFDNRSLDSYPLVNRYLGEKIKTWVKNLANPFEIPWIRALYKGKLNFLEKNLEDLKRKITSTNLQKCFEELPLGAKNLDPIEIVKKIKSIKGEICICGYLKGKKGFKKVEKIKQYGDWKCDDEIIVSVKRKESISAPYEYVENIIKALAYIEENEIVRKYTMLSLNKLEKLKYEYLNMIYKYLRNYLVRDLQESDKKIMNGVCCNETKSFSIDRKHTLKLEIGVNPEASYPIELILLVNKTKNVKIYFSSEPFFNRLSLNTITTDKDAFFDGKKIESKEYIKEYIEEKIEGVCKQEIKPNILWIDILLHPCYEKTIKSIAEQIYFKDIINSKKYVEFKTILSFTSRFGAESVILETG